MTASRLFLVTGDPLAETGQRTEIEAETMTVPAARDQAATETPAQRQTGTRQGRALSATSWLRTSSRTSGWTYPRRNSHRSSPILKVFHHPRRHDLRVPRASAFCIFLDFHHMTFSKPGGNAEDEKRQQKPWLGVEASLSNHQPMKSPTKVAETRLSPTTEADAMDSRTFLSLISLPKHHAGSRLAPGVGLQAAPDEAGARAQVHKSRRT